MELRTFYEIVATYAIECFADTRALEADMRYGGRMNSAHASIIVTTVGESWEKRET